MEEEKDLNELDKESFFGRVEMSNKREQKPFSALVLAHFEEHPVNVKADFLVGSFIIYSEAHPNALFTAQGSKLSLRLVRSKKAYNEAMEWNLKYLKKIRSSFQRRQRDVKLVLDITSDNIEFGIEDIEAREIEGSGKVSRYVHQLEMILSVPGNLNVVGLTMPLKAIYPDKPLDLIINKASALTIQKNKQFKNYQQALRRERREKEEVLANYEHLVTIKSYMETALLRKAQLLINSKKAKIKELQEQIERIQVTGVAKRKPQPIHSQDTHTISEVGTVLDSQGPASYLSSSFQTQPRVVPSQLSFDPEILSLPLEEYSPPPPADYFKHTSFKERKDSDDSGGSSYQASGGEEEFGGEQELPLPNLEGEKQQAVSRRKPREKEEENSASLSDLFK